MTTHHYSRIRIALHWLIALSVLGLFLLGEWMEGLDYTHPWSISAPDWHRSLGILLLAVLLPRLAWRLLRPVAPEGTHKPWERIAGRLMHSMLDIATLAVILSGYLISTADGRDVAVFGWFEVPALFTGVNEQESIAGMWHEWLAIALLVLAGLHAAAALKHHFVDRDRTLRRMLSPTSRSE